MLFETYYNLHMSLQIKKYLGLVNGHSKVKITETRKKHQISFMSRQRLSKRNWNFQTFLQDPKYQFSIRQ